MIPIALQWAIGGLLVSTFLTMVDVPIFYSLFEDAQNASSRLWNRLFHREPAGQATAPIKSESHMNWKPMTPKQIIQIRINGGAGRAVRSLDDCVNTLAEAVVQDMD